jgi:hypothetical protein
MVQSLPPYIGQNGVSNALSGIPLSLPGGCLSAGVQARVEGLRLHGVRLEWMQNGAVRPLPVIGAGEEALFFVVPPDAASGTAEIAVSSGAGRSARSLLRIAPGCLGLAAERKEGRTVLSAEGTASQLFVNGVGRPFRQGMSLPSAVSGTAYLVSAAGQVSNTVRVGKPARLAPVMEQLAAERGKVQIEVEANERRSGFGGMERQRPGRRLTRRLAIQEQAGQQAFAFRAQAPDLGHCASIYSHGQKAKPFELRDLESWVSRMEGQDWGPSELVPLKDGGTMQAELQEIQRVRRGQALELRWRPGAGEAWLLLQNTDTLSTASAMTFCRADARSGRFVVSGHGTSNFPASSADGPPISIAALVLIDGERQQGASGVSIYRLKSSTHVWHVHFE